MVLPFKINERYIAEKERYIVQTIYRSSLVSSFSLGMSHVLISKAWCENLAWLFFMHESNRNKRRQWLYAKALNVYNFIELYLIDFDWHYVSSDEVFANSMIVHSKIYYCSSLTSMIIYFSLFPRLAIFLKLKNVYIW